MRDTVLLRHALPGVHLLLGPEVAFAEPPWPGEETLPPASRAARGAARALLKAFGHAPLAIPRAEQGAPVFPPGLCGSLSHGGGAVAAALGAGIAGVGVDIEPDQPLPEDARRYALTAAERADGGDALARFCAKECVHKALHPATGAWLEFDEVEIALSPLTEGFALRAVPLSAAAQAAFGARRLAGRAWRMQGACVALMRLE